MNDTIVVSMYANMQARTHAHTLNDCIRKVNWA